MQPERRWENTLRITFSELAERPNREEVLDLVANMVQIKETIVRTHLSQVNFTVYLQMATLEVAQEVVERNRGKHGKKIGGIFKPYEIEMEDGATDVRIQDLPYYVTDEELKEAMTKYGEVISIRELRYPAG
uniref:Uncharacterized protein n=1 Tax=Anopheles atroparvus TaxID=41427 RepID=A0A182J9A4_ANOAO